MCLVILSVCVVTSLTLLLYPVLLPLTLLFFVFAAGVDVVVVYTFADGVLMRNYGVVGVGCVNVVDVSVGCCCRYYCVLCYRYTCRSRCCRCCYCWYCCLFVCVVSVVYIINIDVVGVCHVCVAVVVFVVLFRAFDIFGVGVAGVSSDCYVGCYCCTT